MGATPLGNASYIAGSIAHNALDLPAYERLYLKVGQVYS